MTLDPEREARDKQICARALAGDAVYDIATDVRVHSHRVYQILAAHGIKLPERTPARTGRDAYLAVHLSDDVDARLREEANRQQKSLAQMTDEVLGAVLAVEPQA